MKFALLGDDPSVLPLLRAIAGSPRHALTDVALAGELAAEVMRLAPGARISDRWEDLLASGAEGAVVAGWDPSVLEGAKRLAASGTAVLFVPHARQDLAVIYELSLIRDETHVVLFPAFPLRADPRVETMRELLDEGTIGRVLHLQLEREVGRPAESNVMPLLSVGEIDAALLFDVDLLRTIGGDYDQVTALYGGVAADGRISAATVRLAGERLPEATWSMRAATGESRWQLTAVGESGSLVLCGGDDPGDVRLEPEGVLQATNSAQKLLRDREGEAPAEPGDALLARFEAAAAGRSVRPDWTDLTRAFEIVEAGHRSVRRRRTIDLHFETTSERSLFKTQMTALGCGLLSVTLAAVVLLLLLGSVFDVPAAVMRVARIAVFVPLVLFLVLQLLLFLARPPANSP